MTDEGPQATLVAFLQTAKSVTLQEVPEDSFYSGQSTGSSHEMFVLPKHKRRSAIAVRFAFVFALLVSMSAIADIARASGTLSISSSSASFGNVTVGTGKTIGILFKNTGTSSVYINQESLLANMYSVGGLTIPKTLAAGSSFTLYIKFSPTSAKASTGYVEVGSNATDSLIKISVSGTGVTSTTTSGTFTALPTSASFGTVTVGSSKNIALTIKNVGTTSLSISKGTLVGNMYSMTGLTLPKTLAAGSYFTLTVKFAPTSVVTSTGYVQLATTTNAVLNVGLSGTGVTSSASSGDTLTATPTSVNFGSVPVATTNSQVVQLKNTGTTAISVSGCTVSGAGFKVPNYTYPLYVGAGQTVNTTVSFTPSSTAGVSGSMTFASNASDKTLIVALTGNGGSATRTLSTSTSSLNFGNVTVGKSEMLPVTLKNTGTTSLTISSVTVSGANITTSGGTGGATLAAGQSATLDVSFSPSQVEMVSGKVVVTSNASDSTLTIAVAGSGVSTTHSVALRWSPSSSSGVVGYYVYRALSQSTTFSRIFSTAINTTAYTDTAVIAGDTYKYEVTAVSSAGMESAKSSAVTAVVP